MTARPEIIVGYGATDPHNLAPPRVDRKSLYRDLSTLVIVPTRGLIPARVVDSWMSLVRPPNQKSTTVFASGMEVGEAYNAMIAMKREHPELSGWRYVLTLEEDNLVPPMAMLDLLEEAEEHSWDVLGGLYFTKGEEGVAQIWGDRAEPLNFRPQRPVPGEVVECWGTGMGCTLWRADVFDRVAGPWFETVADERGAWTQDLWFFARAHEQEVPLRVGVDCRVRVGHYDFGSGVVW